jgi:hypothetical protein
MTVTITRYGEGRQPGKLAEAELRFDANEGALDGLKLIGFGIWERRNGTARNVTFPARQYSVNGERRSFSLLRSTGETLCGQDRIVALVLQAYADHEESIGQADGQTARRVTAEGALV